MFPNIYIKFNDFVSKHNNRVKPYIVTSKCKTLVHDQKCFPDVFPPFFNIAFV